MRLFLYENGSIKFADFYMIHSNKQSIINLTASSTHLIINDENLTDLFQTCKYVIDIELHDYPLTNNILECMIKNSPICETRIFVNCGQNYDQTLVDIWHV